MRGTMRVLLAGALTAAVAMPATTWGGPTGGGPNARIVDVAYVKELKDGKRHNLVVDVKGPNPVVFAVADGKEYNGHLAENLSRGDVKVFLIRNREFIRGLLDEFEDDGVAKVKLGAGNAGGLQRKQCRLELNSAGTRAPGECKDTTF